MGYLICLSHLVPSKAKGELPDVAYEFVANDSAIGFHYTFTRDRKQAFTFDSDAYTFEEVKVIADLLQMQVKELF